MTNDPYADLNELIVHGISTHTSIVANATGDKFPYVLLECRVQTGQTVRIMLNPEMTVMVLDAISKFMGTIFNVPEVGQDPKLMTDEPIDWDALAPPPTDVVDWTDPGTEPDPDYHHDDPGD